MTNGPVFSFTVNNVKLESRYEKTTAQELLQIAAECEAVDGPPEVYILQSLKEQDLQYKPEDTVDLSADNELIALLFGSTLVA